GQALLVPGGGHAEAVAPRAGHGVLDALLALRPIALLASRADAGGARLRMVPAAPPGDRSAAARPLGRRRRVGPWGARSRGGRGAGGGESGRGASGAGGAGRGRGAPPVAGAPTVAREGGAGAAGAGSAGDGSIGFSSRPASSIPNTAAQPPHLIRSFGFSAL